MEKYKTVDDFLNSLGTDRRSYVLKLRAYILDVEPTLSEHIKWNAPSYAKGSEDRITFNTINKDRLVKLVFHMGATRKEDKNGAPILTNTDLVEWVSDIRGYATFRSLEQIVSNEKAIKQLVRDWIALD